MNHIKIADPPTGWRFAREQAHRLVQSSTKNKYWALWDMRHWLLRRNIFEWWDADKQPIRAWEAR